ncbi:MAG TPA: hypothetical protein VD929_09010 [Caulobacteraceae bacterium]|nr:hypothetical protein [Caulobacteraceae bacterium]
MSDPRTPMATVDLLRDNYAEAAGELLEPLLDLLIAARAAFRGDLDKFAVFLTVAVRTARSPETRRLSLDQVLEGAVETYPSLGTNTTSIAESTGIPRESVRRKVAELTEAGWVERVGGALRLTVRASQELTPLRERVLETAAQMHHVAARLEAA